MSPVYLSMCKRCILVVVKGSFLGEDGHLRLIMFTSFLFISVSVSGVFL